MENQSHLNIFDSTIAFYQGREGDKIWIYLVLAHKLEDLPGIVHVLAPDAAVDDRIECDNVGCTLWFLKHHVKDPQCSIEVLSLTVGFYHSGVDDRVWLDR